MHTPTKQRGQTHNLEACISVLEVIAHPEGAEIETPHDQAFIFLTHQQSVTQPPTPTPSLINQLSFKNLFLVCRLQC